MNNSPKFISILLMLIVIFCPQSMSAQNGANAYTVTSPCPIFGVPLQRIDGFFTSDSKVKRYPENSVNCTYSTQRVAYEEHFVYVDSSETIILRLEGENTRMDVYDLRYIPGDPCSNLLMTIFPSDWDTIKSEKGAYLILVVSSVVSVTTPVEYSVFFDKPTGRIADKCLYSCAQKDDVDNLLFPYEPLDYTFTEDFQLIERNLLISTNCIEWVLRSHIFTNSDTLIALSSAYFRKPELIETIFDLPPLEIDCSIDNISLSGLVSHINAKYPAEEIEEFNRLIESLSKTDCSLPVSSSYKLSGLDKVLNKENDSFELEVNFIDLCGERFHKTSQKFILKTTSEIDSVSFEKVIRIASPLTCNYELTFPAPEGFTGCVADELFYIVEGIEPISIVNGRYKSNLLAGNYTFKYTIYDCCNKNPIYGVLEVKILNQNYINGLTGYINLKSQEVVLPGIIFTNSIYDPCYNIKTEVISSSSSCGSVTNDSIFFCCDDLIYRNDTTQAFGLVKLEVEVIFDNNSNGIFGDEADNFQILTNNVYVYDYIHSMICPSDIILPCTTLDTSPDRTGQAIITATCFDTYKPRYSDVIQVVNSEKSLITRTFAFSSYTSELRCIQKIELDCTVSNHEVLSHSPELIISPNPFNTSPKLTFSSSKNQKANIAIFNSTGLVISSFETDLKSGLNQIDIPENLFLYSGVYFVDFVVGVNKYFAKLVKVD